MWRVLLMCPFLSRAEGIEKYSGQQATRSGQGLEVGDKGTEDRDSTVGAAFSRDLAVSTNFLIL
jgi:hypothetical protein